MSHHHWTQPVRICPDCRLQLPVTGVCEECADE